MATNVCKQQSILNFDFTDNINAKTINRDYTISPHLTSDLHAITGRPFVSYVMHSAGLVITRIVRPASITITQSIICYKSGKKISEPDR